MCSDPTDLRRVAWARASIAVTIRLISSGCVPLPAAPEEQVLARIQGAHDRLQGSDGHDYGGLYDLVDDYVDETDTLQFICDQFSPVFCWRYTSSVKDAGQREPYCEALADALREDGSTEDHITGHVYECMLGLRQFAY